MHPRTLPVLAFLAALPLGCGGGPGSNPPRFRIVTEGTGDPNVAPLSPAWAGIRREYNTGITTTLIGPDPRWGPGGVRFQASDEVRFFRDTDSGQVLDGTARIGHLDPPLLLLPPKVRDGMSWQVLGTEGQALGTFTVRSVGMTPTVFGTAPVWHVTQTNEVTKNEFNTDYAEGIGAVEADGSTLEGGVLPRAARPARKPWPRTPVTPLGDGQKIAEGLWATNVSLIEPAAGPAVLRIGGLITWFNNDGFSANYVLAPAVACAQLSGDVISGLKVESYTQGQSGSEAPCGDASASILDGSGAIVSHKVGAAGVLEDPYGALFLAAGKVHGIGRVSDRYGGFHWLRGDPAVEDLGPDAYLARTGSLDLPWRHAGTFKGVLGGTAPEPDGALGFVAWIGDRLLHGRSDGKGFTNLRLAGSVPGARKSTRVGASGRRHLFGWMDGTIDELVITGQGATLRRLVALDLPEGHELVGAVPQGDTLLVFTLLGRVDFRSGTTSTPNLGDVYAFRATPPPAPPDPEAWEGSSNELDVVAHATGRDVEVCWSRGRAELTGWTIAGAPVEAHAANADGTCVILVRGGDPAATLDGLTDWLVEGPVPAAGTVAIAIHPTRAKAEPLPAPDLVWTSVAATPSGFATPGALYGPAGTYLGPPTDGQPVNSLRINKGTADIGGFGVWIPFTEFPVDCGGKQCFPLARFGDETRRLVVRDGTIQARLFGGGLLWGRSDGVVGLLKAADGSFEELPSIPGTSFQWKGARADGLACGVKAVRTGLGMYDWTVVCRDPGGGTREGMKINDAEAGSLQAEWWPTGEAFYGQNATTTRLWRLDPATLVLAPFPVPALDAEDRKQSPALVAFSAAGELFIGLPAVAPPAVAPLSPVLFGIAGGKAVEQAIPPGVTLEGDPTLLAGKDFFVVRRAGTLQRWRRK